MTEIRLLRKVSKLGGSIGITLPKDVCDHYNINAGDMLDLQINEIDRKGNRLETEGFQVKPIKKEQENYDPLFD